MRSIEKYQRKSNRTKNDRNDKPISLYMLILNLWVGPFHTANLSLHPRTGDKKKERKQERNNIELNTKPYLPLARCMHKYASRYE